jgi:hypothetical protein
LGFSLYCKTTAVQHLILVPSLDKILCSVAVHGTWLSTMECCCALICSRCCHCHGHRIKVFGLFPYTVPTKFR